MGGAEFWDLGEALAGVTGLVVWTVGFGNWDFGDCGGDSVGDCSLDRVR